MYWFLLLIAGLLEAGWVIGIQKSASFTKLPYVLLAIFSMALSLLLFAVAVKEIPISIAYLSWIAVGAAAIAVINHCFLGQSLNAQQLFFLCLIVVGVCGLKSS